MQPQRQTVHRNDVIARPQASAVGLTTRKHGHHDRVRITCCGLPKKAEAPERVGRLAAAKLLHAGEVNEVDVQQLLRQ